MGGPLFVSGATDYTSGTATSLIISGQTFSGNVINGGTVGTGGIVVEDGSTLTGDLKNVGIISGSINVSGSTINGQIFDSSGTISGGIKLADATVSADIPNQGAIDVFSGIVAGGISVDSQSLIVARTGYGILVGNVTNALKFVSTFGGGIVNRGAIVVSGTGDGIRASRVSIFSGGIVNSGVISGASAGTPAEVAIAVDSAVTFIGGITNAATIFSPLGITGNSISTFSGNIVNAGTMSGNSVAIDFDGLSVFSGDMINSGNIVAASLSAIVFEQISTFAGGITNTGTVTVGHGQAIFVESATVFGTSGGGGIVNSGTITFNGLLPQGTNVGGISVDAVSTFLNGITNAGSIAADANPAINVSEVSTFAGAIVNESGGTISANRFGIEVTNDGVFGGSGAGGGIVNSGSILVSGLTAVRVTGDKTVLGGITNTGTISIANGVGIAIKSDTTFAGGIDNSGTLLAFKGIAVTSDTVFGNASTGGSITNTGTISGSFVGVELNVQHVTLYDFGEIEGGNGGAIQFAADTGSGTLNTLTLAPGYSISGGVSAGGSDILQLGGSGSGTLAFNSVGAGKQYTGFATLEVAGGTWTGTGSGSGWTVESGAILQVASGAILDSGTVSSDGTLTVLSGGFAEPTEVVRGGTVIINGGTAELLSGASISGPVTFAGQGGILEVGGKSLPFMSALVVSGLGVGETIDLVNVAFASGAAASAVGSFLDVTVGGTTYKIGLGTPTSFPGDHFVVTSDGATGTDVTLAGSIIVSSGQSASGTVSSGGTLIVESGGTAKYTLSGGTEIVSDGGTALDTVVSSGGTLIVLSGGFADPTVISSGGSEVVSAHGTDLGALISGGTQLDFGLASGSTIFHGGSQVVEIGRHGQRDQRIQRRQRNRQWPRSRCQCRYSFQWNTDGFGRWPC